MFCRSLLSKGSGLGLGAWMLITGVGCNSAGVDLARVSGTVTLDGKPLPEATVSFYEENSEAGQGRPSIAMTDSNGRYVMQYSTSFPGVRPGKYRVTISTFRAPHLDSEENVIPRVAEVVPEVYNTKSTLTADVDKGSMTLDFDLDSSAGAVTQADERPSSR